MNLNLKRLKAERIANGLTQDEMANRMGWKSRTPYAKREAEKMWTDVVTSLYDKLRMESSIKGKEPIYWVKFIADKEILDNFENSMAELEFE